MRIVNVVQRYAPAIGGAEAWCQEVCRQLAASGHDVSVLTLDVVEEEEFWRDPPPERRTLRLGPLDLDEGVRVRRFRRSIPVYSVYHGLYKCLLDRGLGVYFYGPHSLEMVQKLGAHLRGADAVLLHTTPYPHNWLAWAVARRLRKPVFFVPHFHPGHPFYERWHHYGLLRRCDAVIADSEFEKQELVRHGVDPERVTVIGTGVHPERYLAADREDFERGFRRRHRLSPETGLVLFVGRKQQAKGVADLVEACERLARRRPLALLLAGPSSEWFEGWWQARAGRPGDLAVLDLGRVAESEKVRLLGSADVLALPSRFEAFGIVFLEAWAAGTPVVGSDAGAIPSVLGEAGLTVPFGDPGALAEALERVLDDRGLARRLVCAGRERIRSLYTWDRVAAQTARVLARRRRGLRILCVSNLFPPCFLGGAEIVARRHALALAARGHAVRVFAGRVDAAAPRYGLRRERERRLRIDRVTLHPADLSAEERNHDHPEVGLLYRELLHEYRPDVVHVHNLAGLGLEVVEHSRRLGIPVVMTLHDYWGICFKNTMVKNDGMLCTQSGSACRGCRTHVGTDVALPIELRNRAVLGALESVSRFVSPSEYLAARFRSNGLAGRRIEVLSYGIDLGRFRPGPARRSGPCTFGYLGYLGRHKGVDLLLDAIANVPEAQLVLRGPCDDLPRYQARLRALGLEGRVRLEGPVPNEAVPQALAELDALVLPSVWPDNHPVSILEAMAAGLPVVASRVGGIPELVRHGETGFLVRPGDRGELEARLHQLSRDPALRETLGQLGRGVAEARYAEGHTLDALERIYADAIAFPLAARDPAAGVAAGHGEGDLAAAVAG